DRLLTPIVRPTLPPGSSAFPEVDAERIEQILARHAHIECADPHAPEVLDFVRAFGPDYILLAGCPILKECFYGLGRRGALNRHLGMLPEFRAADCPWWAFALDQPQRAGYSIPVVSERVDAGAASCSGDVWPFRTSLRCRVTCADSGARRRKRSWRSSISSFTVRRCPASRRTARDATIRPRDS